MFADAKLRLQVQRLMDRLELDKVGVRAGKRRKLDSDAEDEAMSPLLDLASRICRVVGANLSSPVDELEPRAM
jgi:DNA-binding XRE family transcriptional regulator